MWRLSRAWPCAARSGRRRFAQIAGSETTSSLLQKIQGEAESGTVLSSSGGLLRVSMGGDVFVGQGLQVGEASTPAVVLRFDKTGIVAASLGGSVSSGAAISPGNMLSLKSKEWPPGLTELSLPEVVTASGARSSQSLLRLPHSSVHRRRPVHRHLPSGLAAVETMQALGQGHRVGLVGPPGTGKSTALRHLVASQPPSTAVVFAALQPRPSALADGEGAEAAPRLALKTTTATAAERYFLVLAAVHLAKQLNGHFPHVLLAVDDLVSFAEAASDLGSPPMSASQVVAAMLDAAGVQAEKESEGALSVAVAMDLSPDEELAWVPRELWRGAEPSLDVALHFSRHLAARNLFPAIALDELNHGFAPTFQASLLQQLRPELQRLLRRSCQLRQRLKTGKDLGFQAELEDLDSLASDTVARSLLLRPTASIREAAVLSCAAAVCYFPRPANSSEIASFQAELLDFVAHHHPGLWDALGADLGAAEAASVLQDLARALLAQRLDFRLTRP